MARKIFVNLPIRDMQRSQAPPGGLIVDAGRHHGECFGQQRVAGKDRHALAEDDVRRRPPPAQRVVVHGRQIVVHERVGVDTFDGTGQGKRIFDLPATSFSCGKTKNRTQSFASGKKTVAHRLL